MKKTIEEFVNADDDARTVIFNILDENNYIKAMNNIIMFQDIIANTDRIRKILEDRADHLRSKL